MKNCQDVQPDLSAYVDGELSPSQRADIETHVVSCPRCQVNLAELKKLAAGMAALPKLQPAPRFLAEVRRKIAEGCEPAESITWRDYLFRPFWLKVPLEAVALIMIAMFVVSVVKPRSPGAVATFETASVKKPAGALSYQPLVAQEKELKAEPANEPMPALAGSSGGPIHALGAPAVPEPPAAARAFSPASTTVNGKETPVDSAAQTGVMAKLDGNQPASESHRRIPSVTNGVSELTVASTSTSDVAVWAQDLGIDQAKLRDVVTVDAKNPGDVRNRAEQLAAKCKGRIIPAPQSKEATGQVFFVELPWECAAGFKAELLQNPSAIALADKAGNRDESGATMDSPAGSGSGELTGITLTNATDKLLYRVRLSVEVKPPASTMTVLEIRVVPLTR